MPYSSNTEKIPEKTIRDICYILFRHQGKFLLFFLIVMVPVALWTFITPEIYQSNAKILVRLGRESVTLDPTATTGPFISISQSRENEIKSEVEILKSQELVESVVDTLGPSVFVRKDETIKGNTKASHPSNEMKGEVSTKTHSASMSVIGLFGDLRFGKRLSDRDQAILEVSKNLEIEALKNSNIISISFKAKDRKLAQGTVETLIASYLDKHINVHRTAGSYEFFTEQTAQLKNTLFQAEDNLRELKNKAGIASLEEQRRVLLKRLGDLQQEVEGIEATLVGSKAKVETLQGTLAS